MDITNNSYVACVTLTLTGYYISCNHDDWQFHLLINSIDLVLISLNVLNYL